MAPSASVDDNSPDDPEEPDFYIGNEETATPPTRETSRLSDVLTHVQTGDVIEITFGTAEQIDTVECRVEARRGENDRRTPDIDWEYTLELVERTAGDATYMYRTGIGDPHREPWQVRSYLYYSKLQILDDESEWGRGWIVDARVVNAPEPISE